MNKVITRNLYLTSGKDQCLILKSMDRLGIFYSSETPKRMPLRINYEAVIVTAGLFSVVVTVTVTVTVAWPFPTATFSFTGTPMGATVRLALLALVVGVLGTLAPMSRTLSGLAGGDIAEDFTAGVEIPGDGCDVWVVATDTCALFSLDETWSFSTAVTTANSAFGTERTAAVVDVAGGEVSDFGELLKELDSWTC